LEETYIIPLEKESSTKELCSILDYPRRDPGVCIERTKKLIKIGVKAVLLEGETLLDKYYILGKGTNSIVVKVMYRDKYAVTKILRSDASRESLINEANILKYIKENSHSLKISPDLYEFNEWFLVMEHVEGEPIGAYLTYEISSLTYDELKLLLYNILWKTYMLDKMGVDHGELSNPYKHIYVLENLDVIILDFESASLNRKPKNLTSIYQFLFRSSNVSEYLRMILNIDYNKVIPYLKIYKERYEEQIFKEILKYTGIVE